MVRRVPAVVMVWHAVALAGCLTAKDFEVVHHRANGCDALAVENSLRALECVRSECDAGGLCAIEGDARILRVRGGSLTDLAGDDLEIVWLHDDSTARTAVCPDGDLALPGSAAVSDERFADCRLRLTNNTTSAEPIPTLDDVLRAVEGSQLQLYLELKTSGDDGLDELLARGAADKVIQAGLQDQVVMASFDLEALAVAQDAELRTACFTPVGHLGEQLSTLIRGAVIDDVDECLDRSHDIVFVTPGSLDGTIASHIRHAQRRLGVFGADNADGHDAVQRWGHAIDIVYADDTDIYR